MVNISLFWLGFFLWYFDVCFTGNGTELQQALQELSGQKTVPNVYINQKHIGRCRVCYVLILSAMWFIFNRYT